MPYAVDFTEVSTVGLESSSVAAALAGLRAHEARYFKNKYDHVFTVEPASSPSRPLTGYIGSSRKNGTSSSRLARSRPRPSRSRTSESLRLYESGLSINVMYTVEHPKKRAVG